MTTLQQAHARDACYYGERPDWLIVLSRNRDSDILEQSNFESALTALGGESDTVAVERSSHWAVGWVEYLVIDPTDVERVKFAEEMRAGLEDYPVLDESDYSKREYEEYCESWESWGRGEYRDALQARMRQEYDTPDIEALVDACDELTSDEIDTLCGEARKSVNWLYQSESSGITINIKGLAESTDLDAVIALCEEIITENQRIADIKRLAFYLGAAPAQVNEAVRLDIRTVSGVNALMQGMI